ncbi:hypothetical protein MUP32_00555 [Candidatus Microgenomates bacterium]|nr:hypothetical protein [Candidatus Microgenomates bacterium]
MKIKKLKDRKDAKHFLYSNLIIAFLIIVSSAVIIGLLMKRLSNKDNPSKWYPFFSFYRSYSCIERGDFTTPCYLFGSRSPILKETVLTTLNKLQMYGTVGNNSNGDTSVKITFDFTKWRCKEFNGIEDHVGHQIDINNSKTNLGKIYYCWPTIPLPDNITIGIKSYSN